MPLWGARIRGLFAQIPHMVNKHQKWLPTKTCAQLGMHWTVGCCLAQVLAGLNGGGGMEQQQLEALGIMLCGP